MVEQLRDTQNVWAPRCHNVSETRGLDRSSDNAGSSQGGEGLQKQGLGPAGAGFYLVMETFGDKQ